MGELKKMTYEDLYFYCKDKNPDEDVEFKRIIVDPSFGTKCILRMAFFLDEETGHVHIKQVPVE